MRAGGLIHRQRQIGEDLAEEEPRARVAGDQVGVLADPAQAGIARQRFLQHRRAVDTDPVAERPDARWQMSSARRRQRAAHDLVIVAAERVARDIAQRRVGQHLVGVARSRRASSPCAR